MTVWVLVYLQKGLPEKVEVYSQEANAQKERDKIAVNMSDDDDLIIFECYLRT